MAGEPARRRTVAFSTVLTAGAQVLAMGLGALIALIVLLKFGKTARTDGLFVAYGLYGVVLILAASLRTTVVARLLEGSSLWARLDRFLGAVLLIFLASGVVLVLLGDPVAGLLTGSLGPAAQTTARVALAVLWVAAGAQLVAALAGAALGIKDDFASPGAAYALGGTASIVVLLGTAGALGIDAVPLGVAIGSLVTAAFMLVRLRRLGYRPALAALSPRRTSGRLIVVMVAGAVGAVAAQLTYVVSAVFAAHLRAGAATIFAYANFSAALLIAASSGSAGIVLAARVSERWDGRPEALRPALVAVVRTGSLLVVPALGVAAVGGEEAIRVLLPGALSAADGHELVLTFLALSGAVLGSLAVPVPVLAAFAAGRYGPVAAAAAGAALLHLGLCFVAVRIGGLPVLALVTSISGTVSVGLLLVAVYGRAAGAIGRLVIVEIARVLAVAALCFGPSGLLAAGLGGSGWQLAGAALGTAAFALVVGRLLPEHRALALRFLPSLSRLAPSRPRS